MTDAYEDLKMTPEVVQICRDYWRGFAADPRRSASIRTGQFQVAMREMQIALIYCHLPDMDAVCTARAMRTLATLEGMK
jgi:hypothetical protein